MDRISDDGRGVCCFCAELAEGVMPPDFTRESGISSRVLRSDSNHVLLADARPLAPGHVLVVPRTHVTSLRQLGQRGVSKVIAFCDTTLGVQRETSALAWEHGIGRGRDGG
ncbi:MAG: HIT family protein [Thermoanaerobaculia bacterium]